MGIWFLITYLNQRTGETETEEVWASLMSNPWQKALDKALEGITARFEKDHYWCLRSIEDNNYRG